MRLRCLLRQLTQELRWQVIGMFRSIQGGWCLRMHRWKWELTPFQHQDTHTHFCPLCQWYIISCYEDQTAAMEDLCQQMKRYYL